MCPGSPLPACGLDAKQLYGTLAGATGLTSDLSSELIYSTAAEQSGMVVRVLTKKQGRIAASGHVSLLVMLFPG